jgi:hypothetical protein
LLATGIGAWLKCWLSITTRGIINRIESFLGCGTAATPLKIHDWRDAVMHVCPHCANTLEFSPLQDTRTVCPGCGADVSCNTRTPWIDVARVTNLAEAGFLSDELVGLGIDARIYQLEEFSALTDRWATMYLIRVPSDVAQQAAAHIRQHLADEVGESEAGAMGFRFSADSQPMDPLFWRPVALVVLAGVASFVLGQRFSEQNVERRPARGSLETAVGAIGRPLVTDSRDGQPRHRLSLDRRREAWYLDTDGDNDGRYENRQQFQASGAAW